MKSVVSILLFLAAIAAAVPPWQNLDNWQKLKKYMTEREVQQVLGSAADQQEVGDSKFYFYQPPQRYDDGRLSAKPEYGFIRFALDKRSNSRRPVWLLQTYALPETQEILIPVIPAEEPPQSSIVNRPSPIETSPIANRPSSIQNRRSSIENHQSKTPPAAPDKLSQNGMKYFIGCGILFAVAAVVFSIIEGAKYLGGK